MSTQGQRRAGANESAFREVNEAIERGQWPGDEADQVSFRCECAELGCTEIIELTVSEYERVRANPRRFIVAVGHEQPDVEVVVERLADYVVVEKRDRAADLAEANDPRA
jgi:predicted LPLAT superfamily acyltransferase